MGHSWRIRSNVGARGRHGLDDRGLVIQMLDEPDAYARAFCTEPLNTICRYMVRVEDVDNNCLLRASFDQFQKETEVLGLLE